MGGRVVKLGPATGSDAYYVVVFIPEISVKNPWLWVLEALAPKWTYTGQHASQARCFA